MTVRLLFSASWQPASLLIQVATFSRWSHVDIITETGSLVGATMTHGVEEYDMRDRLKKSSRYAIREIEADHRMIDFVRSQVGKDYDWKGIFGLEFNRDWQEDDCWFCSELAGEGAIVGGNTTIRKDVYRLTPGDLYKYTTPLQGASNDVVHLNQSPTISI